jgi:TonB family protein
MHSSNCGYGILSSPIWAPTRTAALFLVITLAANAQQPAPPQQKANPSAQRSNERKSERSGPKVEPIKEDELRHQFEGKTFYLRGGYSENEIRFDANGHLQGTAQQLPYTLSMMEINKVHLSKHRVELDGIRFGLHFLGGAPGEDPIAASDKVRITPKKKMQRIVIERAEVVNPKKKSKSSKDDLFPPAATAQAAGTVLDPVTETDAGYVMTQAHSNELLKEALDRVFSPGLDDRMIASLPDYWRFYYQVVTSKSTYKPSDRSVLRQGEVDQKARLLTKFEPPSNDFAQAAGVAGVAQYHVVVDADGKPGEIAVGRPIGFGLDENAVASIRKASFSPAMKDGKPVPVVLDLFVQFRIYSKRTASADADQATSAAADEPEAPTLPGPYSANQPATKRQ